jgi:predicted PurR-regulated permease PerM
LAAIFSFFLAVGAVIVLFFWAAVPPALHQIQHALRQHTANGGRLGESTGVRHDVLAWVQRYLHQLPSGHELLHPWWA